MNWVSAALLQLAHAGAWAPVLFIGLYVGATVTFAPAFLLTIASGAIFGLWRGTLYTYLGAVLGSSAVYVVAAPLARSRALGWLDRDARVAAVRRAVVGQGLWVMFLLRLSPLVPYVFLNYALALSGVRYRDYLFASVGMLPTVAMYVYYGKVVGDVTLLAAGQSPPRGPEYWALLTIGLIATVLATTMITRTARRAMDRQEGSSR
jgi:uncharacterized membrane protein YdjX (TVP38/TMEM64 family)